MPITGKTYLPGADLRTAELCDFVTKYGDTIIAVTGVLSPTDVVAMSAFITAVQSGCLLVKKIHKLYDPNFEDTVADGP